MIVLEVGTYQSEEMALAEDNNVLEELGQIMTTNSQKQSVKRANWLICISVECSINLTIEIRKT